MNFAIRSILLAALFVGAAAIVWLALPSKTAVHIPSGVSSSNPGMAERGTYVVQAAGCISCHWDRKHAGQPFAGGVAFATQFGTFYSPNITSDAETGIGGWSDEDFVRALTEGEGVHGEQLYPALPYTSYSAMRVEDALAIKGYLARLPPVKATRHANDVSFPLSWRGILKGWKLLYFAGAKPLPDDPSHDATWNRGRYLVIALGHCAECHTPRDAFGAQMPALVGPEAKDFASWSMEETATYLKSGVEPGFDSAEGPMAEVIEDNTKHLSDQDRAAIALYLKSLTNR